MASETTLDVKSGKLRNNNSDPAQYSYELTLNFPFYDKLESTGNLYVSKMPILSRDKVLQDSIRGYVGKEVAAEGLVAWGLVESRYLEVSTITDMSSWTVYTNKTFGYSIKFPTTYERQPGTDEQTTCVRLKSTISPCAVLINAYDNKDNLALDDYINSKPKSFALDGTLISYNFNGYDSLFNKNQPGMYLFIKRGLYVYRFTAPKASTDKEIGDIVATFKFVSLFPTAQSDKAMTILQKNPSIQYIQRVIANNGTKAYLEPQNEKGDVVEINLIEGNFPDKHTTRIDTFMVNVKTGEILIYDVVNNKNISLKDWGMTITQRFPDYGPQKVATVLVQDGSTYGPPFDPNLYQLEISKSQHLFAKSDLVDLKKYLGKTIKVHYREVKGVVMGEQQLVIVDSVE